MKYIINKLKAKFSEYDIDGYIVPKNDDFFTEYSKSTASEDMAEVYSHLIYLNPLELMKIRNLDPILDKKISFIEFSLEEESTASISGFALVAESVRLLDQKASISLIVPSGFV